MRRYELLESLNPVPETRGDPGAWETVALSSGSRSRRTGLLVAAALCLLAGISAVLALRSDEPVQLAVSDEIDAPAPDSAPSIQRTLPGSAPQIQRETDIFARLIIPAIDVDIMVRADVDVNTLRAPVGGHYPSTALPGQQGNAAITAHRTTYGSSFHRLDELKPNHSIFVTADHGVFEYVVVNQTIYDALDDEFLNDFGDNRLTLITEHPRFSSEQRLVVIAELIGDPAPPNLSGG